MASKNVQIARYISPTAGIYPRLPLFFVGSLYALGSRSLSNFDSPAVPRGDRSSVDHDTDTWSGCRLFPPPRQPRQKIRPAGQFGPNKRLAPLTHETCRRNAIRDVSFPGGFVVSNCRRRCSNSAQQLNRSIMRGMAAVKIADHANAAHRFSINTAQWSSCLICSTMRWPSSVTERGTLWMAGPSSSRTRRLAHRQRREGQLGLHEIHGAQHPQVPRFDGSGVGHNARRGLRLGDRLAGNRSAFPFGRTGPP